MTETKRHLLLLTVLGAVLYFIGNWAIAITDPVESNYTQTALEMLESGDYVSPRIFGHYWYDKPIFFYLELIAAFSMFGVNEFAARFFPGLFGILGLWMTYGFARRIYNAKTGLYSAIILGTCFEYWLLSKTVITDLTLFVFFNAVLVFFYIGYTSSNKNWYILCYIFSALAVLTKGPIGLLLPGFVVTVFIVLKRDFKEILNMKLWGFLVFAIVAGSWYYAMYQLHGREFIDTFLGIHNVLRATVSEHPQWDVWWYYTMIFFAGFLPWCFVLPAVIIKYVKRRELPSLDQNKLFLLIWAISINGFYQLMATKYTTYTLPGLLPIAILTARYFYDNEKLVKRIAGIMSVVLVILTFTVAIPVCRDKGYSGKAVADIITQYTDPDDLVINYGDYKVSMCFYSHRTIYNIDTAESIEGKKPKAMDWSSKNVMPMMTFDELPKGKKALLILNERKFNQFEHHFNKDEWKLVGEAKNTKVFLREGDE